MEKRPDPWVRGEGGIALYRESMEGVHFGPGMANVRAERTRRLEAALERASRERRSGSRPIKDTTVDRGR